MIEPSQWRPQGTQQYRPKWDDGTPAPYAIDNGAWGCFQKSEPFNAFGFSELVDVASEKADFITLPDIVAGGLDSLELSLEWIDIVPGLKLIPLQDGMTEDDLRPYLSNTVGLFLGGSTEWKVANIARFGRLAKDAGCYYHVGRVNTRRRIRACALAGADSFDGTSVTRFAQNITHLDAERRQGVLCVDE